MQIIFNFLGFFAFLIIYLGQKKFKSVYATYDNQNAYR